MGDKKHKVIKTSRLTSHRLPSENELITFQKKMNGKKEVMIMELMNMMDPKEHKATSVNPPQ
jgi:hypothetical protein